MQKSLDLFYIMIFDFCEREVLNPFWSLRESDVLKQLILFCSYRIDGGSQQTREAGWHSTRGGCGCLHESEL
jgi:hypothetical protein